MRGLTHLDIESSYAPINDILVHGKKISGNAQTRKYQAVLQHGTILTDVDVEKMFSLLKVPNEKIRDKMISNVKERVTSIKHQKGGMVSFDEVAAAMRKGFEETFDVTLKQGTLIEEEKDLTKKFISTCFGTKQWNQKR